MPVKGTIFEVLFVARLSSLNSGLMFSQIQLDTSNPWIASPLHSSSPLLLSLLFLFIYLSLWFSPVLTHHVHLSDRKLVSVLIILEVNERT